MATKKWAGGYIDPVSGYWFIRKRLLNGRRAHFSTGWKDKLGAESVWNNFRADPEGYLARVAAAKAGGSPDALRPAPEANVEALDDAAALFVRASQYEDGNSVKHVTQQTATLEYFRRYLLDTNLPPVVAMLTLPHVKAFLAWRRQGWNGAKRDEQGRLLVGAAPGKPVGEHSVAIDAVALKRFAAWCVFTKRLPADPLRWDRSAKTGLATPTRPTDSRRLKVITDETWERVKAGGLLHKWAILGDVLLDTGLRYSSMARLELRDIDEEASILHFPGNKMKGKKGKHKKVRAAVTLRKAKLVAMAKIPPNATDFDHALARACEKAGVPVFSAHTFRSTFASRMLAAGFSIKEIQKELMHASATTTERYLDSITGKDSGFSAYAQEEDEAH